MFNERIAALSLVAVLSTVLNAGPAAAACSDRPGTPNELRVEPISATAIRLHWRNTTNKAGGSDDMWFDISVRDGRNQQVGKDITGGARQRGVRYGQFSAFEFTGLKPDTEYRFQMRARTEGGTQGCISGQPSGVAVGRTPTTQLDGVCINYTNTALRQLATAKAMPSSAACPVSGPRWTSDRSAHYGWCLGVRGASQINVEQKAREDQLNVCRGRNTADPRTPAPNTFGTILVRGVELVTDAIPPKQGTMPIVAERNFLAGANLCSIAKAPPGLPDFDNLLKSMVGVANAKFLHKSPFKLRSDVSGSLSSSCAARAEMVTVSSNEVRLILKMPGNQVTAAFTTPDAHVPVVGSVGAPRSADPRARVTFDVEAQSTIRLPANTASQMGLGPTTVRVSNVHVQALNIPAKIALITNDVIAFFTGTDFLKKLTQDRIIRFGALNTSLNNINANFKKIPPNFRLEHEYNSAAQTVVLHATGRAEAKGPVVR